MTRLKTLLIVLVLVLCALTVALEIVIFVKAERRPKGRPDRIAGLREQLDSYDPIKRYDAIIQLADAEHNRIIYLEPAYDALRSDPSDEVRRIAAWKLSALLNSASLPDPTRLEILKILLTTAEKDTSPAAVSYARSGIVRFFEENFNTALGIKGRNLAGPYLEKWALGNDTGPRHWSAPENEPSLISQWLSR
jgi:hypothetical protein